MLSVKTRKQGNSVTITIPKNFDIGVDEEFYAIKKENGSLVYIPVIQDFFANTTKGEFRGVDLMDDYKPIGTELVYD